MSRYTEYEHEYGLKEAKRWWKDIPRKTEEKYEFAMFQYRLYNYAEAVRWLREAVKEGHLNAKYQLAYCLQNGLGVACDSEKANQLFLEYMVKAEKEEPTIEQRYQLGICYAYGFGCIQDNKKAVSCFTSIVKKHSGACYELGKHYRDGTLSFPISKKMAMKYFLKADQLLHGEAIMEHFYLWDGTFEAYPYQREVKEAYSFKLGRLIRATEFHPSVDGIKRVIAMYEKGYPGDQEDAFIRFQRKAILWGKKLNRLERDDEGKFIEEN